jgi:hypothetical protein
MLGRGPDEGCSGHEVRSHGEETLRASGRRSRPVLVSEGSGFGSPDEARPDRAQETGLGSRLLLRLALLASSLISLIGLVLLVRWLVTP